MTPDLTATVAARPVAPLLRDDLVIASRERRRDPELPAATVDAALAASLPTDLARYDLVPLRGDPASSATRLADRLAAAAETDGHRVLRPTPGADLVASLAELRGREGIETAALLVADPSAPAVAAAFAARRRWGWRLVVPDDLGPDPDPAAGAPSPLDRLRFAADVLVADRPASPSPADPSLEPLVADASAGWPAVDRAVRRTYPRASVAVVTWDGLAFTRLCLASLLANTDHPNHEIIVVDNASTDGTPEHLRALAALHPHLKIVVNRENRGFGPANNQALAIASGEILVLLNNDTIVPPGWLTRLARHLDDPDVGLIGAATNRAANEAQVDAPYATYGDFLRFARARAAAHDGERRPIRMPLMFCLAMRRDVYARVGPLDERYEVGMFEDEDYALRVKALGLETAWAPDAYVHHAYHASVGKLLPSGDYTRLFHANRHRFEQKWGISWERHRPPPQTPQTPTTND